VSSQPLLLTSQFQVLVLVLVEQISYSFLNVSLFPDCCHLFLSTSDPVISVVFFLSDFTHFLWHCSEEVLVISSDKHAAILGGIFLVLKFLNNFLDLISATIEVDGLSMRELIPFINLINPIVFLILSVPAVDPWVGLLPHFLEKYAALAVEIRGFLKLPLFFKLDLVKWLVISGS